MVGEKAEVAHFAQVPSQQVLQRRGAEEILLPQAQFLPRRAVVGGVEDPGDRLGAHLVRQRAHVVPTVEGIELHGIGRARAPQPQRVHMAAAPADHRRIVGHGIDRFRRIPDRALRSIGARFARNLAAEADAVADLGAGEFHRIAETQPILGVFLLPAIAQDLPEQAVVVADSIAEGRDTEA